VRRRFRAALALAALTPVVAATPVAQHEAQAQGTDPVTWNALAKAINATLRQALERQGVEGPVIEATIARASEFLAGQIALFGGTGAATATWALLLADMLPQGTEYANGMSNGGGAGGSWDVGCLITWSLDAAGNLIIPSMPVVGSGPIVANASVWRNGQVITGEAASTYYIADSSIGQRTYQLHRKNLSLGNDARNYLGFWKQASDSGSSNSFEARGVAYRTATGALVNAGVFTTNARQMDYIIGSSTPERKPCPESEVSAEDIDFYAYGPLDGLSNCLFYMKNTQAVHPSGYAINKKTTVPAAQIVNFPTNVPYLNHCRLSDELIRRIAEYAWQGAAAKPGYDGAPVGEVLPEDVRHDGEAPDVEDLGGKPAQGLPTTPPTNPVEPTDPVDPNNPTDPGEAPPYDPTVTNPELVAPEIDWWPDLPTVSLNVGTATCPIYNIDVPAPFSWALVLDSHCPLIEDNRALISTIMLLMFSLGGILIVLRA
jgi:hypothetical protein